MVSVARIAAVSYLDTMPFIYGIRHEGNLRAELLLLSPSDCLKHFVEGQADMALLPASVVPALKASEMITDYCIGASGPVRTSVLLSDSSVGEIKRIFVDPEARTSVQLAGYLAANRWSVAPEWYELSDLGALSKGAPGDAFLLVGDKVFDFERQFACVLDLAEEWKAATSLPFVFSVWMAHKGTSIEVMDALQLALTFGVEHTYEAILEADRGMDPCEAYQYLTRNIDYIFDAQKRQALQKFWSAGLKIAPRVNPG